MGSWALKVKANDSQFPVIAEPQMFSGYEVAPMMHDTRMIMIMIELIRSRNDRQLLKAIDGGRTTHSYPGRPSR